MDERDIQPHEDGVASSDATDQSEHRRELVERVRTRVDQSAEREQGRLIHVIINPVAGKGQPVLKVLNAAMQVAGVAWEVFVTKAAGDCHNFVKQAVEAGVDQVIVYGGDGTIMEAASALMGTDIPLAIIPGGTGNVMSAELRIPLDLVEACALAVDPEANLRAIDLGRIGEKYTFMLRAGVGLEAAMVEGADRELKDRVGSLAYAISGLQALSDPPIARYRLELDGEETLVEGLTCIVANSGNVGVPGMYLAPNIDVSDGLLDVIVVRSIDLPALASLLASVVGGLENPEKLAHWQAKEITLTSDPVQKVQVDGEILCETPFTVRVVPQAVKMIVPSPAADNQ
ncbi:MAG: diacylglycerol kinase family lipid kinase [Anaerolineales bacterium]